METQLRKRMEQVKELFADCTDVFEELVAVKKHLAEKIDECQSAVECIQCSVSNVDASEPLVEEQIQVHTHFSLMLYFIDLIIEFANYLEVKYPTVYFCDFIPSRLFNLMCILSQFDLIQLKNNTFDLM